MMELVPVRVRDCACPGTPHPDGDIVNINPKLPLIAGLEAQRENGKALTQAIFEVLGDNPTPAQLEAVRDDKSPLATAVAEAASERLIIRWLPLFIRHGAASWNLEDESGPRPFDVELLLADFDLGKPVADAAADLYAESLMRPLAARLAKLSPPTPTNGTPRATRRSRTSTRKPRSSSSRRASAGRRSPTSP